MNKRKRGICIIGFILFAFAIGLLAYFMFTPQKVYELRAQPQLDYVVKKTYDESIKNYQTLLCDKQNKHFPSAKSLRIEPQEDDQHINKLLETGELVEVPNSQYLSVKADYPYLIPNAYDLLLEIGRRYQEKTGGRPHLRVTSCLRTRESIKKLQNWNPNSVKNSCHLYGTTFDISYAYMSDSQKEALARVLKEMRDAGYLHALYEINQPCFHVTMRKPGEKRNNNQ